MAAFREFRKEHCSKNGEQKTNLTKGEYNGLKSLKKRVDEGEIVVVPTDKTGKFCVMARESYLQAGLVHTQKDVKVGLDRIREIQGEINGNMSMLIKVFKLGRGWDQVERVRETMIGNSLTLCPLYLTYKDHKGWDHTRGTPPPTRPIAGGNTGLNLHLSEVLSEVTESVAAHHKDTCEVISTEDMIARIQELNEGNKEWSSLKWWEGKTDKSGKLVGCSSCQEPMEGDEIGTGITL